MSATTGRGLVLALILAGGAGGCPNGAASESSAESAPAPEVRSLPASGWKGAPQSVARVRAGEIDVEVRLQVACGPAGDDAGCFARFRFSPGPPGVALVEPVIHFEGRDYPYWLYLRTASKAVTAVDPLPLAGRFDDFMVAPSPAPLSRGGSVQIVVPLGRCRGAAPPGSPRVEIAVTYEVSPAYAVAYPASRNDRSRHDWFLREGGRYRLRPFTIPGVVVPCARLEAWVPVSPP